jgi:hypothetical protein
MSTPEENAAVLNGIADELEKLQEVDSNASGFVIRLRGLQLRASETVLQALESNWLEGKPWSERLRTIAKFHADSSAAMALTETNRRIAMLRNLWIEIVGGGLATVQVHPDGTRTVTNVRGDSLFPTPFECREIAVQGLQPDAGKEWQIESARQARLRGAFICRTIAAILNSHPSSPAKEKWPGEEYARDAIIRLREHPELQKNVSAFCRTIAKEQGVPEIAVSLKKLLYEPEYKPLWKSLPVT